MYAVIFGLLRRLAGFWENRLPYPKKVGKKNEKMHCDPGLF